MNPLIAIADVLQRTPHVIRDLCNHLPENFATKNEGPDTWSVFDIIGHMNHGERTDWIPRLELILSDEEDKTFTPFDRFAQFEESKGKTLNQLIDEFSELRENNLFLLSSYELTDEDLKRKGTHPALGEVDLHMLLHTWATHDLNHISQISRVIAFQMKDDVGPWKEYLRIIKDV